MIGFCQTSVEPWTGVMLELEKVIFPILMWINFSVKWDLHGSLYMSMCVQAHTYTISSFSQFLVGWIHVYGTWISGVILPNGLVFWYLQGLGTNLRKYSSTKKSVDGDSGVLSDRKTDYFILIMFIITSTVIINVILTFIGFCVFLIL